MGIYVWGTGCGAAELLQRGLDLGRITAFVDSFPGGTEFMGKPVLRPEELPVDDCELMIVSARHADAIAGQCDGLGLARERCFFLKNSVSVHDRNAGCGVAAELLGQALVSRLVPRHRVVPERAALADGVLGEQELQNDYVRLATLELLCRGLAEVPGAAAELGVYRGFFAGAINRLLPERRLYLFDSFRGFLPGDGAAEAFQAAHANTAVQRVLERMPSPEQVQVMPGFFPDSLGGLEERFCLVSLDVDFYRTTLEGLRYFWPRLNSGGYLLLHDWGNPALPGVARALEDYRQELGVRICGVPLCDVGGTLVLSK